MAFDCSPDFCLKATLYRYLLETGNAPTGDMFSYRLNLLKLFL